MVPAKLVSGFRKLHVDSGFCLLLNLHVSNKKLELEFLSIAMQKVKAMTIVSGVLEQISIHLLTKPVDVTF